MASVHPPHHNSDNDQAWNYNEESIRLMALSVVQIKSILTDGSDSVNELTDSFISIADKVNQLMSQNIDEAHLAELSQVQQKIGQGIVAFQFYDRISQRLDHVSNGLNQMAIIAKHDHSRNDPQSWQNLQDDIRNKYTMESERVVFNKIMEGESIENALIAYQNFSNQQQAQHDQDIELF